MKRLVVHLAGQAHIAEQPRLSVLVALMLAFLLLIGVNVGALTTPIVLTITLSAAFAAPLLRELFKTITRSI